MGQTSILTVNFTHMCTYIQADPMKLNKTSYYMTPQVSHHSDI